MLLIIMSLFAVTNGDTCPDGTSRIGEDGTFLRTGSLITLYGETIDNCKTDCEIRDACDAFTFDDDYLLDSGSQSQCMLHEYDESIETGTFAQSHPRYDQVVCLMDIVDIPTTTEAGLTCPDGTSQIGELGGRLIGATMVGRRFRWDIDRCKDTCTELDTCNAFQFDEIPYQMCNLYTYDSDTIVGSSSATDQVLCYVDRCQLECGVASPNSPVNAGSGELFVINGDTAQVSMYIVYAVIGLVLVNMICIGIMCWRKCVEGRDNKLKYKVVSMSSDTETDIEC